MFGWPVGEDDERSKPGLPKGWSITTPFGLSYWLGVHTGVDLDLPGNADAGKPVYAIADGEVVYAQAVFRSNGQPSTWGNLVVIKHALREGVRCSRYGHLATIAPDVRPGAMVRVGQVIGTIGRTGGDAGAQRFSEHLHWDITGPICATPGAAPYWPNSRALVEQHFYDPIEWMNIKLNPPTEPGAGHEMVRVVSQSGLNIRTAPPALTRIGSVPYNTRLTVDLERSEQHALLGKTYTWTTVVWAANPKFIGGWIAYDPALVKAVNTLPPVETPMRVLVNALRVRSAPKISAPVLPPSLKFGEVVGAGTTETADGYVWRMIPSRNGYSAERKINPAERYMAPVSDAPFPVEQFRTLAGFHVVNAQVPYELVIALAETNPNLTFVINNNIALANDLISRGVKLVIFRLVDSGHDPFPVLTGNPDKDRDIGYDYFFNGRTVGRTKWSVYKDLDPRIPLIYINEWVHPNDGPFTEGLILAADSMGRRLVNFNDPVGNPHMWRENINPLSGAVVRSDDASQPKGVREYISKTGRWRSTVWEQREEALRLHIYYPSGARRPKDKQHFVGYHAYGAPTNRMMTNPADWEWYAGRFVGLYETTPYKPMLVFTECGPFDARDYGPGHLLEDMNSFESALQKYPYVQGMAYWTLGVWDVTNAGYNSSIPAYLEYLRRR